MGQVVSLKDRPKVNATERAFLPAHLELLQTPPSPTMRATAWTLAALVIGALAWACLSEVEIVATAHGRLVPVGEVKQVQPLETSVVRGIHVAEGDHVTAGQVLIDLDPTEALADLETTRLERMQALLDAEAARMLLHDVPEAAFGRIYGVNEDLQQATLVQLRHRYEEYQAVLAQLQDQIDEKRAALTAKSIDIGRNAELVPLAEDRYATQRGLYERGNASKLSMLQAQYDLIDKRADQRTLPEQERQLRAELAVLERKQTQMRSQFRKEAADQRVKALQKLAVIDQTMEKGRIRENLRHLRAPVTGTVQDLKVHTVGGIANSAESLLTLVPDGAPLEIEAYLPSREIGFIQEGQSAEIKFEAFPFTRYGTTLGTVRLISKHSAHLPAAKQSMHSLSTQSTNAEYRIWITPDMKSGFLNGYKNYFSKDLQARIDIVTGKRKVISFIVDPIINHVKESAHER